MPLAKKFGNPDAAKQREHSKTAVPRAEAAYQQIKRMLLVGQLGLVKKSDIRTWQKNCR